MEEMDRFFLDQALCGLRSEIEHIESKKGSLTREDRRELQQCVARLLALSTVRVAA